MENRMGIFPHLKINFIVNTSRISTTGTIILDWAEDCCINLIVMFNQIGQKPKREIMDIVV